MNEFIMQIILGCASVIITACATIATKKATAWLEDKKMLSFAKQAVDYAEQLCKTNKIKKHQRKETALLFLKSKGIDVPEEVADMLIESVLGGINTALKGTKQDVFINTVKEK